MTWRAAGWSRRLGCALSAAKPGISWAEDEDVAQSLSLFRSWLLARAAQTRSSMEHSVVAAVAR
jgi:hypothetical protein